MNELECYDEWWLPRDMENMGFFFEYCSKYTKELFGIEVDEIKFLNAFMRSNCRHEMETGHPSLLSQAAMDTVEDFIKVDCNGDCAKFERHGRKKNFTHYQLYWIGWIYAYIHFRTKLPSKEIVSKLSLERMLDDYYLGHEMAKEVYFDKIKDQL